MIIVSQDRDLIINFDNVTVIGIAQNNSKEIDSITVDKEEQYLGEYKTEERAKEVLQEIVKTYVLTEQYKVEDERTRIKLMMEGVLLYEMPKE